MTTQGIFSILLQNNKNIWNHYRNIQALLIEFFKMKNELAPPIMASILNKRINNSGLRKKRTVWS